MPDTEPDRGWPAPAAAEPIRATVRLPGSKSMTARALVLAGLASGVSRLRHPLRARDTELMAAGLAAMGTAVDSTDDDGWRIVAGELAGPARVDVGLSGTVMRFLPPVAALATGPVTFDGDARARERPLAPLLGALQELGVRLDASAAGGLPVTTYGVGRVAGGEVTIDASASSQLVSGLLLAAAGYDKGLVVRHSGRPVPSRPHLDMTVAMLRGAGVIVDDTDPDTWAVSPGPIAGRDWSIEPDLSNAAPFLAAALVTGGAVTVPDWPAQTTQAGDLLRELLARLGGRVELTAAGLTVTGGDAITGIDADLSDASELTPVLAAVCALASGPSRLTGVAHIRTHETDRIAALARELSQLGAAVTELPDGLEIRPRPLRGAVFETYADHRMAHAAAVIGLRVPGVVLSDVACTSKTMPEFPVLWRRLSGRAAG